MPVRRRGAALPQQQCRQRFERHAAAGATDASAVVLTTSAARVATTATTTEPVDARFDADASAVVLSACAARVAIAATTTEPVDASFDTDARFDADARFNANARLDADARYDAVLYPNVSAAHATFSRADLPAAGASSVPAVPVVKRACAAAATQRATCRDARPATANSVQSHCCHV